MKPVFSHIIKIVVGVLIIGFLMHYVGFAKIIAAFKNISWIYLIIALAFLFINFLLNTANMWLIARTCTKSIGYWRMFKYYIMTLVLSLFLPGLVGQLSMIFFLRNENLTYSQTTAITLVDKIVMFVVVIFFSSFSLFLLNDIIDVRLAFALFAIAVIIGIVVLMTKMGRALIIKLCPAKLYDKIKKMLDVLLSYGQNKKMLALNLLIGFAKWIARGFYYWFLFYCLGLSVPFTILMAITSLEVVISVIPITFSGLGLRESIGTFIYSSLGYDAAIIMAGYTLAIITIYGFGLIVLPFIKLDFGEIKKVRT